jgi:hypothetical protein
VVCVLMPTAGKALERALNWGSGLGWHLGGQRDEGTCLQQAYELWTEAAVGVGLVVGREHGIGPSGAK